jgi:thymidylate synthase
MFLGVPFNIASYSLLTHIIANICDMDVGWFVHTMGDAHIYLNHVDAVKEQLNREVRDMPQLIIPDVHSLDDVMQTTVDDYKLDSYDPWPTIKATMAI